MAFIVDVWDDFTGEGVWNPVFGRHLTDWEMEEVQNFLNLINARRVNQLENDACAGKKSEWYLCY